MGLVVKIEGSNRTPYLHMVIKLRFILIPPTIWTKLAGDSLNEGSDPVDSAHAPQPD